VFEAQREVVGNTAAICTCGEATRALLTFGQWRRHDADSRGTLLQ